MITPTLFLGPPGTGKTQTLLETVLMEMERGVPPDRIGFMTFTKRGVEEAITRAAEKFKRPRQDFRHFNTLHSAAFRHLGLSSAQVFTGKKIAEFGETFGFEVTGSMSSEDGTFSSFYGDNIVLFLENYSRITHMPIPALFEKYDSAVSDVDRAYRVVRELRKYKKEQGLFDFTDMIEEFIKIDDPPKLEVLIIDEAQDLSRLQWEMVELLSRHAKRVYVAGDDDQTIFTWAGASEHFITMDGNTQVLEQSHRVPITVHALANRVISKVTNRRNKPWNPRQEDGSVSSEFDVFDIHRDFFEPERGSVMMLARTTKMLRNKFVPFCRLHGLPYRYFDANGVKTAWATGIAAWMTLHSGGTVTIEDALRVYDLLPAEGHGKVPGVKHGFKTQLKRMAGTPEPIYVTMETLQQEYGLLAQGEWERVFVQIPQEDVKYINKLLSNGFSLLDQPHIQISTIHRVKGGQADSVVLLSDTSKAIDRFESSNPDEETRVFYTGITRTYRDLIIVQPERRHHHGGLFE